MTTRLAFCLILLGAVACGGPPKASACDCAAGATCVFLSGTTTQVCARSCTAASQCPSGICGCASSCAFCKDCINVCL